MTVYGASTESNLVALSSSSISCSNGNLFDGSQNLKLYLTLAHSSAANDFCGKLTKLAYVPNFQVHTAGNAYILKQLMFDSLFSGLSTLDYQMEEKETSFAYLKDSSPFNKDTIAMTASRMADFKIKYCLVCFQAFSSSGKGSYLSARVHTRPSRLRGAFTDFLRSNCF